MLTLITGMAGTGKTIIANALKNMNKIDLIYDDVSYYLEENTRQILLNKINKSLKSKKNIVIIVHDENYLLDNLDLKDEMIRIINVSIKYINNTKLSRGLRR